jgi:multidrug resistance protein
MTDNLQSTKPVSPDETSGPPPSPRWMGTFIVLAFLVGADTLVVSPLVPVMSQELHFAVRLGGLLVTSYALVYALLGSAFGPISDRIGRRPMILIGLAVFLLGTAATGVATSYTTLIICRAIAGLGAAAMLPSVFAFVADQTPPQRRGQAIGTIVGALMAASVLGVPLGSAVAGFSSWRWAFWGIAFLSLFAALAVWRFVPALPAPHQIPVGPFAAYVGQFRSAVKDRSVLIVLLSTLLWSAGLQSMFANIGLLYATQYHLGTTWIGVAMLGGGAASVVGTNIGGRHRPRVHSGAPGRGDRLADDLGSGCRAGPGSPDHLGQRSGATGSGHCDGDERLGPVPGDHHWNRRRGGDARPERADLGLGGRRSAQRALHRCHGAIGSDRPHAKHLSQAQTGHRAQGTGHRAPRGVTTELMYGATRRRHRRPRGEPLS